MIQSLIQPKRPTGKGWKIAKWWVCPPQLAALGYPVEPWIHENGLFVLSAVEVTDQPDEMPLGPLYHVSITRNSTRATGAEAAWVIEQFGMSDAEEDNHVPGGKVRNFWRPVADHLSGYECPCKEDEPVIKEDKGDFEWRWLTR